MTWRVTAKPQQFNEAIAWFRKRVPMSDSEFQALENSAKRKAFTVAGVAQLDLVHDVWSALDAAIANGTALEEFKTEVGAKLAMAWSGDNPRRLETIFRTNVQQAYAAGRYAQINDPDILETRPYWQYDSILDGRTSSLCKTLNGTILPHDHEFWRSHIPPLHFRCRSGLRSLTLEQAQTRGITERPSDEVASEGFGLPPEQNEWQPVLSKYAAPIRLAHQKKMTNPDTYASYYANYGFATMTIAWGNAMLERGLDAAFSEVSEVFGFTPFNSQVRAITGKETSLREILDNPNKSARTKHRARVLASIFGHMTSIEPHRGFSINHDLAGVPVSYRTNVTSRFNQALKNMAALTDQALTYPADIQIIWATERSRTNGKIITMNYKQFDCGLEHELTHVLENFNPQLRTRATAFFEERTRNEKTQLLNILVPDGQYDADEETKVDGFFDPYVGKIYNDGYTEINAMGVQYLLEDATLFEQDFEHLLFTLGQLAGR